MKRFILLFSGLVLTSQVASAFPVDPAKVPVSGVDLSALKTSYTLAYDSTDKSIVYYSPKTGRLATFNGMPIVGFAQIPGGEGYFNAQFEFEIANDDRATLLGAIRAGGYSPAAFPYNKTTVKPIVAGYDPDTGKRVCQLTPDLTTGEAQNICQNGIYSHLTYIPSGPTLGENIAVSARLTTEGSKYFGNLLRGGNAFQVAIEAEYYVAGDAFTAVVEVNYSQLYEQFSASGHADGFFYSADLEAAWGRSGLCVNRSPDQCAVRVRLTDGRGRSIDNLTIDPDSPDMSLVSQAIDRLKQKLEDEMLVPVAPLYGPAKARGGIGYHFAANYQNITRGRHAQFQFKSVRSVHTKKTTIVATAACISVSAQGVVTKETQGACVHYWSGGEEMDSILDQLSHPLNRSFL